MDVSREITLPVDRETAWEAVTDLDRWLTSDGSLDLEPGAEGELTLPRRRDALGDGRGGDARRAAGVLVARARRARDARRGLAGRCRRRPRDAGRRRRARLREPARVRLAVGGRRADRTARPQRGRRDGLAELPDRPRLGRQRPGLGAAARAPARRGRARRGVGRWTPPSRRSSPRSPTRRAATSCARSRPARPAPRPSSPRGCRSAAKPSRSTSRSSSARSSSTASRAGRETRFEATPGPLADAIGWMTDVGAQWDTRLAALREAVRDEPSR